MPCSSIAFIKLASLYRGGGSVKCCSVFNSFKFKISFSANGGKIFSVNLDGYIFSQPSNLRVEPFARKIKFLAEMSAVAESKTACCIWQATNLLQIKS